ncbi:hypothetical protein DWY46_19640 [Blautia obeum]|jgi:hypothetical protein|uniref:Uncharacterized protein n=1 Tax=Blautia obeum TaxID=40520 RepID=A0A412EK41_9FIRM|nr:hypothetical protein [Blautia obeum]RGR43310.1 hypothetical protein DWY46_19640 [Blautia obeum]DAL91146.1 MAG TPA: hypothetical protein [Caudoviricetes sp.]DAZ35802.1 MAG TPA: hypothetical protein [Caudoviricetes sp.]
MAKFNEYPVKTTPKDADKFMLYSAEDAANKLIDYDKLADAVLNKLTSKTFGLDQGTMTLPAALNQLNSNRLKPFYKGMITNRLVTVPLVPGLYLVSTYRSGGYKISSLSIVNIQIQDGSFIETLVKGADYDNTIEMKYTDSNISFQYKIDLSGGCTIVIFKLA